MIAGEISPAFFIFIKVGRGIPCLESGTIPLLFIYLGLFCLESRLILGLFKQSQ